MLRRGFRRHPEADQPGPDLTEDEARILDAVRPYTMTSVARQYALLRAVEYVERRRIPGAYAECGVWRGGSVMAMLLKLLDLGVNDRDVFVYDTFAGMPRPSEHDTSAYAAPALDEWRAAEQRGEHPWSEVYGPHQLSEKSVREALVSTGYPVDRIHVVAGRVEETLPASAPERLALLRLDTDWYESTKHELETLYPRLSEAGVLIVDDYGHWDGCRRAVDEYFAAQASPILLSPVDYTGRIGVKA